MAQTHPLMTEANATLAALLHSDIADLEPAGHILITLDPGDLLASAPRVHLSSLGVGSVLAYRVDPGDVGRPTLLSICAEPDHAFDQHAILLGGLLAAHTVSVLDAASWREHSANLERALSTRGQIATAVGVIMAEHDLTQAQAFDLLATRSQHTNTKVADLAAEILRLRDRRAPAAEPAHDTPSREPAFTRTRH